MNEERMEIVMGIIMHGGNAKGLAFQAIQQAKEGGSTWRRFASCQ